MSVGRHAPAGKVLERIFHRMLPAHIWNWSPNKSWKQFTSYYLGVQSHLGCVVLNGFRIKDCDEIWISFVSAPNISIGKRYQAKRKIYAAVENVFPIWHVYLPTYLTNLQNYMSLFLPIALLFKSGPGPILHLKRKFYSTLFLSILIGN